MEDKKYIKRLLELSSQFDLDKQRNLNLHEQFTPFEGSPKHHPSNENILILVVNPFDENKKFYEFYMDTISAIEEIGTLTSDISKSAYNIRVWVKRGTMAVRSETFIV